MSAPAVKPAPPSPSNQAPRIPTTPPHSVPLPIPSINKSPLNSNPIIAPSIFKSTNPLNHATTNLSFASNNKQTEPKDLTVTGGSNNENSATSFKSGNDATIKVEETISSTLLRPSITVNHKSIVKPASVPVTTSTVSKPVINAPCLTTPEKKTTPTESVLPTAIPLKLASDAAAPVVNHTATTSSPEKAVDNTAAKSQSPATPPIKSCTDGTANSEKLENNKSTPETTLAKVEAISTKHHSKKRKKERKEPITLTKLKIKILEGGNEKKPKRSRVQTQPYQAPLPELQFLTNLKRAPTKPKAPEEKLVAFYRNEFLAVRNQEGSFYVCQTMQNVHRGSHKIKIRWLSLVDSAEKNVYSADFYDVTDFECILTNLEMERLDKNKYHLPVDELTRTQNILERALAKEKGDIENANVTEEHPDGLDLSLYKDESQLKKRRKRKKSPTTSKRSPKGKKKAVKKKEESDLEETSEDELEEESENEEPRAKKQKTAIGTVRKENKMKEKQTTKVEKHLEVEEVKKTRINLRKQEVAPIIIRTPFIKASTRITDRGATKLKPMTVWSAVSSTTTSAPSTTSSTTTSRRRSATLFMESLGLKGSRGQKPSSVITPPKGKVTERRKTKKGGKRA